MTSCLFFFFFFQAEDGIRDYKVTGVQTCALPIFTMFRRSDFIEEMYAFSFVLANFGIAMAARMPMITTTIKSSMSVKPLRFMQPPAQTVCLWAKTCRDRFEQGLCRR